MEKIKKAVIDTNLLVRYLTEDDPQKAKAVENLLKKAERNEIKILIPSIVIAELVWVLESFYKMEAFEIAELIDAILHTPGFEISDKSVISSALKIYKTKNKDFVDAWICEFARGKSIKSIYTFDKKHFKNIEGIEALIP